jgi:small GTP-binding protein
MSWLSKFFSQKQNQRTNIVVLGASGCGKTTLVRYLETGQEVTKETKTTLGIDVRQNPTQLSGWTFGIVDVGGQDFYRKTLWSLGVSQADSVIYLIDGTVTPNTDQISFEVSKFSFDYMLDILEKDMPILVLVNKQDEVVNSDFSLQETILNYDIGRLIDRRFNIVGCSVKTGDGVKEALEWLAEEVHSETIE